VVRPRLRGARSTLKEDRACCAKETCIRITVQARCDFAREAEAVPRGAHGVKQVRKMVADEIRLWHLHLESRPALPNPRMQPPGWAGAEPLLGGALPSADKEA